MMEPREIAPAAAPGVAPFASGPPSNDSKPAGRIGSRREAIAGYAFISIPMVLFAFLSIGTVIYALYISFWKWNIRSGPQELVGLDNYARILNNTLFQTAIKNTVYYAIVWVPLTMMIGLFLAIIVNQ